MNILKGIIKKNSIREQKNENKVAFGMAYKLLMLTIVTVISIVILGWFSYSKASNRIIENYETTTYSGIKEMGLYYSFLLTAAEQKTLELYNNETLVLYYSGQYENEPTKDAKAYKDMFDQIKLDVLSSEYIEGISVIGNYGRNISTYGNIAEETFGTYIKSTEGQNIVSQKGVVVWQGRPEYLLNTYGKAEDEYGLSVARILKSKNMSDVAFINLEISKDYILNSIQEMDLLEGSYLAVFSPEGRVYTTKGYEDNLTLSVDVLYTDIIKQQAQEGVGYIEDGKYLRVYSKLKQTGVVVCCIIPKSILSNQASDIKILAVIVATIAILITVSICIVIANGLNYNMKQINQATRLAADGDLTPTIKTKRRDEFRLLAQHVTNMLSGMRGLIQEIFHVTGTVASSAAEVRKGSVDLNEKAIQISHTMQEIEKGIGEQAQSASSCICKMEELSNAIANVVSNTKEIRNYSSRTSEVMEEGIDKVNRLAEQSQEAQRITQTAMTEMEMLHHSFDRIQTISETMNEIADKTNLLSLNATIEAARAGVAGRGFSVVADEIRKLAVASSTWSAEISSITSDLQSKMDQTLKTVEKAEHIVGQQGKSLETTAREFSNIGQHMEDLNENITLIGQDVKRMEVARDDTKLSIEMISAVLEQTFAATTEVLTTTENQVNTVSNLHKEIETLEKRSDGLLQTVRVFKIS